MNKETKPKIEEVTNKVVETTAEVKNTVVDSLNTAVTEVKETVTEVKDTVINSVNAAVTDVKETASDVKDTVADSVNTAVTKVKDVVTEDGPKCTTTKKQTWWNRIWSALVGAIMAVAATLGITNEQINEQKAKTEEVKTAVIEALDSIKAGDVKSATTKLQEAVATGKDVINESKKIIDNVKKLDKEQSKPVVNSVVEKK